MKKAVKNGSIIGLSFSGIALLCLRIFGVNRTTLTGLLYLYVLTAVFTAVLLSEFDLRSRIESLIGNIVVVIEGEELVLKRLVTGEKYEVKGDLEKIQ